MTFLRAQNRRDFVRLSFWALLALALFAARVSTATGTWAFLSNSPPSSVGTMLLLPNGTVMANDSTSNWFLLTPDIHGSYVNGTWSTLSPMHYSRLYFASDVLPDGRVLVAGGEYGNGAATAEIYDPLSDTWTVTSPSGQTAFNDCISTVLPDGTVMVAPDGPAVPRTPVIYDPTTDTWTTGPEYYQGNGPVMNQEEASWVKLPDRSILTIDPSATSSERFIPSLNEWVGDTNVPVILYNNEIEIGPGLLLPNGQVIYFGGNGYTAIYDPSGTTNAGSWVMGPDIPDGLVAEDNPCAMMVNGKILCAFGPQSYSTVSTSFYEYDPDTNGFNFVESPYGRHFPQLAYALRMLDLPDGTVLVSASSPELFVYQPDGSPLPAGKPAISSIATNDDGSYLLTGTLLNGISAGAAYGDDAQMDSNYPLVRMCDTNGNVYYARTANWSSTGVMTGSTPVTTQFWLPGSLPGGTYSLVVVANGNSSDPVPFTFNGPAVSPLLVIQSWGITNGAFQLTWNSVAGQTYHVQYQTDFRETNWADLAGTITATNNFTTAVDTNFNPANPQMFYRVLTP